MKKKEMCKDSKLRGVQLKETVIERDVKHRRGKWCGPSILTNVYIQSISFSFA